MLSQMGFQMKWTFPSVSNDICLVLLVVRIYETYFKFLQVCP